MLGIKFCYLKSLLFKHYQIRRTNLALPHLFKSRLDFPSDNLADYRRGIVPYIYQLPLGHLPVQEVRDRFQGVGLGGIKTAEVTGHV